MSPSAESEERTTRRFRELLDRLYRRAFQPRLDARTYHVAQSLRSVGMFAGFDRATIRGLAESLHVRLYKRDEYIYRERDPGLGMFIVRSGRVRLLSEDEEGNMHESHQVGDFEIFGHLALLGDFRRFETAQAVTETSVFGFFRPELKAMIKRDPRTAAVLLFALAGYAAEQHVSLYNLLVEKEGKMIARRMHHVAAKRIDSQSPNTPLVVRP